MNRITFLFICFVSLIISTQSSQNPQDPNRSLRFEGNSDSTRILSNEETSEEILFPSGEFFMYCFASFGLCCFAGLMSGLTVGYLAIDELQLELKMKNGTDEEKRDATVIMPILAQHHLLLSTLLVANAFAMETLPICLHKIVPAYLAVIISTVGVVVFGEILPQAVCTGPQQIKIAKNMAPFIKILIKLLWIVCYPISKALDHWLGTHKKTRFVKQDLKALIELHQIERNEQKSGSMHGHGGGPKDRFAQLTAEETKVINSTIDLRDTPVTKEMERIEKVFMLSDTTKITKEVVDRIVRSGFSKIPIYSKYQKNKLVGILKVKSLIDYHHKILNKTLAEAIAGGLSLTKALIVSKDTSMLEMMMLFQRMRTAVALISDDTVKDKNPSATLVSQQVGAGGEYNGDLIGLISLKDIFEEILESKMNDDDVHGAVTMMSGTAPDKMKKRKIERKEQDDSCEMLEKPEKGLGTPLLTKKK